jgi:fermentation-respiration switch protein FrsA (DUF1100 family)
VPDAFPSLALIRRLRAPLLVLHGEADTIVPAAHGEALFEAAPEPKRLLLFSRAGHNDLLARRRPSGPRRSPPGRTTWPG